jgi:translocation and assembly module TamB
MSALDRPFKDMDYRVYLKKTGKWVAVGVAVLIILMAVLWGLGQTGLGKQFLAQWISASLGKGTSFQVKIGKITGNIPFNLRLDELTISHGRSEWLVVENAFLSWSPASLLKGKIYVNELGAAAVRLKYLPDARKEKEKRKPGKIALLNAIPSLHINRLVLERLYLGESILGSQAVFTMNGRLISGDHEGVIRGSLHIDRKDGEKALYHVDWSLTGQTTPELELDVRAQEDEGGLLTRVLGLKETGPVAISLKGKGPLNPWKGRLIARADRLGAVETTLEVMIKEGLRLKGDGQIMLSQRLLEKELQPLMLSQKTRFHFDSRVHAGNEIEIHRVLLENDGITLKLAGRIGIDKKQIQSDFDLRIDDLSRLKGLVKSRVQGKVDLHGRVTGTLQQPKAIFSVTLNEPGWGEISASNVVVNAQLTPTMTSTSDFQGFAALIKGHVKGLTHKTRGPLIPGKECRLFLEAEMKKGDLIDVKKSEVSGKDFVARFSGQFNTGSSVIDGNTSVEIHDLFSLSHIMGTKVHGSAGMDAHLKGNLRTRSLSADIKGRIARVAPLPALLKPLLEEEITYACHARLEKGRHLAITDLLVRSAVAEMGGEASLDLQKQDVSAQARLHLPRLAVFSKPAGRPLDGALEMKMDVGGTLKDPGIRAHATMSRVRMEDIKISKADISLMAGNVFHKPEGNVKIHLERSGHSLKAVSNFTFINPLLSLNGLSVSAPGTDVTGDLKIRLKGPILTGVLRGTLNDLPSFSSLFDRRIDGKAQFDVVLSETDGGQDVAIDLRGKGLGTGYGNAEALALSARLKNVFQAPEGSAEVEINSFKKEKLEIHHMILKAEGQKDNTAFKAHANGHYREEFKFETMGSIGLMPGSHNLRLNLLKGNFGELAASARKPVVIRKISDHYILEGADFQLGEGHLEASGRVGSESLTFDARLNGLPLSLLQSFGYPELLGTAMARIHVEGPVSSPEADMEIVIKEIKLKNPVFQKFPPANLAARMTLKNHHLQAALTLENLAVKPVKADLHLPVTVSFLPFVFSLKSQDRLKGQIFAEIKLERLTSFFYLEDHTMEGNLVIDLAVDGNMEKPAFKGHVGLSDGVYEHALGGTIIKGIQIDASITEDRLTLEKAQATDGENGKIVAKGRLHLLPEKGLPLQMELHLDNSTLVRRDDLTVTTNGKLDLSGSMEKMNVSGAFTVGPAEISIPRSLPPEVKELKVEEINLPDRSPLPTQSSPGKKTGRLKLDLSLEIPGRVFVRGRGLDSEWRGKIHITGSELQPVVTGSLSVIRGRYNFFGKPFSLTKGDIYFGGDIPPAPRFDVTAEHIRSDINCRILVSGNPSTLTVKMESDPTMPSDEILAHLLFGRSATNITPFQALRLAQAVDSLRGGGSGMFDFMDRTRKLMGVDELNIKQSGDKKGETAASVGKYVRDNVYMEVEQGLGADSGKVSVEIELTPHIGVETDTGANGQSGVGVNWRWDY